MTTRNPLKVPTAPWPKERWDAGIDTLYWALEGSHAPGPDADGGEQPYWNGKASSRLNRPCPIEKELILPARRSLDGLIG